MDIKILIACHKPAPVIQNEVFTPIKVGRCGEGFPDTMLSDGTGDNISDKNPLYNELTAVYWAWKNYDKLGSPDYLGLHHYRRHFIFREGSIPYYEIKEINGDFYKKLNFSEENLEGLLKSGDFIAPMPAKRQSVRKNFMRAHDPKVLELAENIISRKYPEYVPALNKYLDSKEAYFYNMFIFDKDTFFRYSEWLFDILFEIENLADFPIERMFISERLTGVFFTKLMEEGKKPVLLPTLFVAGKKDSFAEALRKTGKNLKAKQSGLLYSLKPIIVYFIPDFVMRLKRARKCK